MTHAPDVQSITLLPDTLRTIPGVENVENSKEALWAEGALIDVDAMGRTLMAAGLRYGTITATPLGVDGETAIIYHFLARDGFVNVKTTTRNGALASLAATLPVASWAEREIKDLFAVDFQGHPDPRPLMKPAGFEDGMMRAPMCGPVRRRKIVPEDVKA